MYIPTYSHLFSPLENSPFSLPFRPHPHVPLAREQGEEVGEREDGKKERERKRGGEEGAWASARYWCIKRAYLRSLFSRMWTPGMHRSREEGNRAPDCITSAIYLFYPGGWIKLVYGIRTRACCVYARRKPHKARICPRNERMTTPFDLVDASIFVQRNEREREREEDTGSPCYLNVNIVARGRLVE